jgi:hypothetical protein
MRVNKNHPAVFRNPGQLAFPDIDIFFFNENKQDRRGKNFTGMRGLGTEN